MALQNLQDVFNESKSNGGNSSPSKPTPPEEQSPNINPLEKLYKPDSKLASTITFGNPVTTDYKLGTGVFNNPDVYDDSKIKQRTFDTTKIGQDNNLGTGDFVLETLYNVNHTPNEDRIQIQHGQTLINTGRAGMGSFKYMDIKASGRGFRQGGPLGFGDGREPYIVNEIGSKTNSIGNNRDILPFQAALEDVSRLAKFYTSTAGLAFIAKENITNIAIGDGVTLTEPFGAIMAPPIPVPNTGFLNFYQQTAQGAGLGSIRKPFKIQYSDKANVGSPFGILGDSPIGIVELMKIEIPPEESGIVKKGLYKLKKAVLDKLEKSKFNQFPVFSRTPFIDRSGGPKNTNYVDNIAKSGVVIGNEDFFTEEITPPLEDDFSIVKGDFYVRIKDLRTNDFIYFRGYVTGITENVNPSFTPTYLYERGERDLSFNLRVYPANIIQQDKMYEKLERLTSLAYPEYLQDNDDSSVTRMKAPFTELYMAHIGNRVKGQFGFIKSLSYTVPGEGDWDALSSLPRLFDISISYQILSKRPPSLRNGSLNTGKFYGSGA